MKRLVKVWLLVPALVWGLFSCEEANDPPTDLPVDSLLLRFSDTTTIRAHIERDDTLRTDATERVILGSYYDPVFGKTTSAFYSTFTIAQTFVKQSGSIVDSVILTLRHDGDYGDVTKLNSYQVLQVFELTEEIPEPPDEGYNSTTSFNYDPVPIATQGFVPQFATFGNDPAAIRIRINPAFASRFFAEDTVNSSNIKDLVKGIYVRIDPNTTASQSIGQGGLSYFKLTSDVSRLQIFYHVPPANDVLDIKLSMGTTFNYRFSVFDHDNDYLNTADPALQTKLADTTNTVISDKLYIQALEGIRVKVSFPYLSSYKDSGNVIINKAELIIPIDESQDIDKYKLPGNILTYTLDSERKVDLMDDINYTYYDSYYNDVDKDFKVVITQYLQQIINDENVEKSFYIDIPILSKYTDGYRIVIHSAEHAIKPIKLNLTYTRIPSL